MKYCRYKKVADANRLTGRGRSTWEFMDALRPILDKDPAVNPPCIASAGSIATVDSRPTAAMQPVDSRPSEEQLTPTTTKKRKKSELTSCIETFTEESKRHRTLIREELKQLVQEEKRRNDLFEKFIDTLAKK